MPLPQPDSYFGTALIYPRGYFTLLLSKVSVFHNHWYKCEIMIGDDKTCTPIGQAPAVRYFIAALLIPVMIYFCRIKNSSTMGIMAITAPAMISLKLDTNWPA